jgi:hypothetical protein
VRRAGNLTTSYADCLEILEASTPLNPKGLSRPVIVQLYLYRVVCIGWCMWVVLL